MIPDNTDPNYELFLRWRGVTTPCPKCKGSGVHTYPNTATWWGGRGLATPTRDVCDGCWGSGDMGRHGVNLRAQRDGWDQAVATAAGKLLFDSVGGYLTSTRPAILAIAGELERLSSGRTHATKALYFDELAQSLAKTLRTMVSDPK